MSSRIHSFDYIRALAIIAIVICHYFLFSSLNSGVGHYLSGIGNRLFFLLSALLYGERYLSGNQKVNQRQGLDHKRFILKRIIKLGSSVWPFLILLIALFLVFNISFSWLDVGLNFVFLGYIGYLPGNGHLWFLTVMMACYAEYMLLDRIRITAKWFPWLFLVTMGSVMVGSEFLGFPGSAFGILGFFGFVLMKRDWFMRMSKSLNLWACVAIVLANVVLFWLEWNGLFLQSRIAHYLLCDVLGCLMLAFLIKIMPEAENKTIAFISSISFEIYLVHHTLCAGPLIRVTMWPMPHLVKIMIVIALSFTLAVMLHWLSDKLNKTLTKCIK